VPVRPTTPEELSQVKDLAERMQEYIEQFTIRFSGGKLNEDGEDEDTGDRDVAPFYKDNGM